MSTSPPRRLFNLMDAMVLVAATAAGLGIARAIRDALWELTNAPVNVGGVGPALLRGARGIVLAYPLLVAWTIALLLLVFLPRRFRPSRSELLNGPGKAACGAAAIAITIGTVNVAVLILVATVWHGKPWTSKVMIEAFVDAIKLNIGVELRPCPDSR